MKILLPQRPGVVFEGSVASRANPMTGQLETVLVIAGNPPLELAPPDAQGAEVQHASEAEMQALTNAGYRLPVQSVGAPSAAMRMMLPVGRSGWAIAAGYAGLFSLIVFPAPIAVILSAIAMWHLRKNPELHGWGRAIFGMVLGVLGSGILLAVALK